MEITDIQINELKAKHGNNLELITLDLENGKKAEFVIKTPSRSVIDAISEMELKGNADAEAAKILIVNCVILGDTDLIDRDGRVYMTLLTAIRTKIRNYKFEVKKF